MNHTHKRALLALLGYGRNISIIEEIAVAKKDFQSTTSATPATITLTPETYQALQQWAESTAETVPAPDGSKRFIPGISIAVGERILGMTILEPCGESIRIH